MSNDVMNIKKDYSPMIARVEGRLIPLKAWAKWLREKLAEIDAELLEMGLPDPSIPVRKERSKLIGEIGVGQPTEEQSKHLLRLTEKLKEVTLHPSVVDPRVNRFNELHSLRDEIVNGSGSRGVRELPSLVPDSLPPLSTRLSLTKTEKIIAEFERDLADFVERQAVVDAE